MLQVSLHTGANFLVEAEGTVSAHVFNIHNSLEKIKQPYLKGVA